MTSRLLFNLKMFCLQPSRVQVTLVLIWFYALIEDEAQRWRTAARENPDWAEAKLVVINPPDQGRLGHAPGADLTLDWLPPRHPAAPGQINGTCPERSKSASSSSSSHHLPQWQNHDGSGGPQRREAQSQDVVSGLRDWQVSPSRLWVPIQRLRHHGSTGSGVWPSGEAAARWRLGFCGGIRVRPASARGSGRVLVSRRVSATRSRLPVQPGSAAARWVTVFPPRTPAAAAGPNRQPLSAEPGGSAGPVLRYDSVRLLFSSETVTPRPISEFSNIDIYFYYHYCQFLKKKKKNLIINSFIFCFA